MNCETKCPDESVRPVVCCRIGCDRPALYELRDTTGDHYSDYTHSCEQCVDELFFDGCNSIEKTPWLVNVPVEVASP